jgi:hypothetical protein
LLDYDLPSEQIVAGIVLLLGLFVVVFWARKGRARRGDARREKGVVTKNCDICRRDMVFHRDDLVVLSPVEKGLAVRGDPSVHGKNLREYVCPYCEATHLFSVDGKEPVWAGVNLYGPQELTANCRECGKRLRRPPWPKGEYDGHLQQVKPLEKDYGLHCERCGAVCCVKYCQVMTRNLTEDGSLLCPRCTRGPLAKFFHP